MIPDHVIIALAHLSSTRWRSLSHKMSHRDRPDFTLPPELAKAGLTDRETIKAWPDIRRHVISRRRAITYDNKVRRSREAMEAQRDYMREYMRRRRAAARKPKRKAARRAELVDA